MFPEKFKNSFFLETFQNSCSNYLVRPIFVCFYEKRSLSGSICFSFFGRCLPFLGYLCKVTFNIPEAYLGLSQLSKMELSVKIVKIVRGFHVITIFAKSSILDV